MAVGLIDLRWENEPLREEFFAAFQKILDSGQFILNEDVPALESECEAFFNLKGPGFACAVSSGTDALLLALMALEIPREAEVLVPTFTFFATAGVVARYGAKIRFVDIEEESFNLDTKQVESSISPQTKAIIPVHLFGQMADMDHLKALAREKNLFLIEDACQSMGAKHKDLPVGHYGDFAAISFFPTKNLGAFGDAGLLLSRRFDLKEKVFRLRVHGMKNRYEHLEVGGNFRMDSLQAAILRIKLKHLAKWQEKRRQNAALYYQLFGQANLEEEIVLPKEKTGNYHVFNQFVIRVKNGKRDSLREFLNQRGISTMVYYPSPLHTQPCFAHLGYKKGDFPVAEKACGEVLALPIHPAFGEKELTLVVETIQDFYRK